MKNYDLTKEIIPLEEIHRIHEDLRKKKKDMAKAWAETLRAELNTQLIETGKAEKIIYSSDMKAYERADVIKICKQITEEFKTAGYNSWDYEYSRSNKEKWFSIDIYA